MRVWQSDLKQSLLGSRGHSGSDPEHDMKERAVRARAHRHCMRGRRLTSGVRRLALAASTAS